MELKQDVKTETDTRDEYELKVSCTCSIFVKKKIKKKSYILHPAHQSNCEHQAAVNILVFHTNITYSILLPLNHFCAKSQVRSLLFVFESDYGFSLYTHISALFHFCINNPIPPLPTISLYSTFLRLAGNYCSLMPNKSKCQNCIYLDTNMNTNN